MKILTILTNEKIESSEKVEALNAFVAVVRDKYGNTDKVIEPVKVPSTHGHVSISMLTQDEKAAVAEMEIREIVSITTSVVENTEGSMFDRVFEGFIAVNPVLTNLDQESESSY